jgi:threonylcarbamoyladenosine tRNA methylthiotransferase MtaB
MKFAFYTLGCKTNQYETQAMERLLMQQGHEIGQFDDDCDGYIVNTCSVTAVADKKNRAVIRRCRRDHPDAIIGVCGCYSQHDSNAVKVLGVDVIGGSARRQEFVDMMLAALQDRRSHEDLDVALRRRDFEVLPAGGLSERTRAMLKVQDGCVNFCTYCIIPYTRGPIRSASVETAVEQARELADRGYREVIITGIEIFTNFYRFYFSSRTQFVKRNSRTFYEAILKVMNCPGTVRNGIVCPFLDIAYYCINYVMKPMCQLYKH